MPCETSVSGMYRGALWAIYIVSYFCTKEIPSECGPVWQAVTAPMVAGKSSPGKFSTQVIPNSASTVALNSAASTESYPNPTVMK